MFTYFTCRQDNVFNIKAQEAMNIILHKVEALTMYLKISILFVVGVLAVNGFEFLSLGTGYKHLMKQLKLRTKLSGNLDQGIDTKWIEQKLDHFDVNETRSWKMRYLQRLDLWKPNGPVYLMVNGEGPAQPDFLTTGMMYKLARETKGAMFLSEHRYYGESRPLEWKTVEDMKYLSSRQALADNANLLRNIKNNQDFKNSKIVVVGGSYAGNLAAWMKLVYPDLVDAAIASSGPVLAKRDFHEYLEVVSKDYERYGTPGCFEKIQKMFQRYNTLFQTDEGVKQLKEEENICEDSNITEPLNKQLFFLSKISYFMVYAQYAGIDVIKAHCKKINETHNNMFVQTDDEDSSASNENTRKCQNYSFGDMIKAFLQEKNKYIYCWIYQTCTEFGYFQSTTSDKQPFTKNVPVEFFDNMCTALFGVGFDQDKVNDGVRKTNKMYGGLSPNVTNVVFVNGELDPWSALGVVKDISNNAPAVYITKSTHCADLLPSSDADPDELTDARHHIKGLIKKWIGLDNNSV